MIRQVAANSAGAAAGGGHGAAGVRRNIIRRRRLPPMVARLPPQLPPPGPYIIDENDDSVPPSRDPRLAPTPRGAGLSGAYRHAAAAGLCPALRATGSIAAHRAAARRRRRVVVRPPGAIGNARLADAAPATAARRSAMPPQAAPQPPPPPAPRRCRRKTSRKPASRKNCRPISSGNWSTSSTKEPAGTIIVDTAEHLSLSGARRRQGAALRRARRPRRLHLDRHRAHLQDEGMAGLVPAAGNDRAPALSAAHDGGRPGQSARRARHVSRAHALPHPRHQPALDHRSLRVVGLRRHAQRRRRGSLHRVQVGTRVVVLPGKAPETVANTGAPAPLRPAPASWSSRTAAPAGTGVSSAPTAGGRADYSAAVFASLPIAALTRGITSSAISCIERRASCRIEPSPCPA